jgi:hypothetical protein
MGERGIFVEITINSDFDRVWELTQDAESHARWDLRFSSITPFGSTPSGGRRFTYARRVLWHTIRGTGTSLGERLRPDGTGTSALRFTTTDRMSPLGNGRGYWRYVPGPTGLTFTTGFDYEPGWSRLIDRLLMRRVIGWMTAWSFDRLRIWAETGTEPERWPMASVLAFWRSDRPRAARCRRQPRQEHALDDAPRTLDILEAP